MNTIKKIAEDGQFEEAHAAIENLLDLGPKNVEALKLKAALFAHTGRWDDEELVWRRVIEIDGEDEDAIAYYQSAQLEDREHYYFTDALPGGGRRFLAYPKSLVTSSFVGLVGCVVFLMLTRGGTQQFNGSPLLLLSVFLATVISPWFAIIYMYVKTIRSISLTQDGFEVATRVRRHRYPWKEIDRLVLAHSDDLESSQLRLLVIPKDQALPSVSIDIDDRSSAVRARRHLLAELRDYRQDVEHSGHGQISLNAKNLLRF